jgi:hypothetical protein
VGCWSPGAAATRDALRERLAGGGDVPGDDRWRVRGVALVVVGELHAQLGGLLRDGVGGGLLGHAEEVGERLPERAGPVRGVAEVQHRCERGAGHLLVQVRQERQAVGHGPGDAEDLQPEPGDGDGRGVPDADLGGCGLRGRDLGGGGLRARLGGHDGRAGTEAAQAGRVDAEGVLLE